MILAIDLGGTKVSLALVDARLEIKEKQLFTSHEHPSLAAIVKLFLASRPQSVWAVVAGVAGPVIEGRAEITNLPWLVSEESLRQELSIPKIILINDIEAYGWGALNLKPTGFLQLNPGIERLGNCALIAPGTGLGECIMPWMGSECMPSASEGGHSDFAPSSREDLPFVEWLYRRYPRISWERVVSGSFGFRNIYEFLKDSNGLPSDVGLDALVDSADFGRHVSVAARQNSPIAQATMRTFCRFLGAEAGNLALKACAIGGLYIGGGIAPQILAWIQEGGLLAAFCDKGRQKKLLEQIPIRIILDPDCSLYGAAYFARRKFGKSS